MPRHLFLIAAFVLIVLVLSGQETKPQITTITMLPSEPPLVPAKCTASWSGYLEKNGRTKMAEAEIAKFVRSSLRDGYVLTIYPESKRGVFVNMECGKPKELSRP
jgi:hypothetical protein